MTRPAIEKSAGAKPVKTPSGESTGHSPSARVVSLGCRLNIAEGATIERAAEAAGVGETVVINSCAVTNEAVRRTRQTVRRARSDSPDAKIVVTGCAAQIDPQMFAEMDEVDVVLGNHEKLSPATWKDIATGPLKNGQGKPATSILVNDIMSVRETAGHLVEAYGDHARAFLQIQNGCDHRCTFCIIPFGRGPSRSAPIEDVVAQARRLVDSGHLELVLTGVDITSWGDDIEHKPRLGNLVDALLRGVNGLFRLRLSSIDGAEIDPLLADLIKQDDRIAPHVHLSVQSGDNLILKRMKRRHSREDLISLCHSLREARPEIAFGADIIAGFPTETNDMFDNSLALIEDAGLNYLHVFPFSPRTGAAAARMPQVPGPTIKERAGRLRQAGEAATTAFLDKQIGKVAMGISESGGSVRLGNFAQIVPDTKPAGPGKALKMHITERKGLVLNGTVLPSDPIH